MVKKIISIIIAAIVLFYGFFNCSEKLSGYILNQDNVIKNSEPAEVRLLLSKENRVISIKLEEYVKGVISGEMPLEYNIEALKAQAVAARTYAVAHMAGYKGRQYDKNNNIDLIDTVECQVYIDRKKCMESLPEGKRDEYMKKIDEAVDSTKGEVITYEGNVISEPFFFSCSSGNTENSEDVFSAAEPYLRSVDSAEDKKSPEYEKVVTFSNETFIKKINSAYSSSKLKNYNLKNQINIISRSDSGSIKKIKVGAVTMTGLQFRSVLNLNSANMDIKFYGSSVEIKSKGYGHGVGMSQCGANYMAKDGKTYKDILKHYYQGVNVEKLI
ncbi:MAG: stage II sporulation protein D [Solirubrobacterales bacterium]